MSLTEHEEEEVVERTPPRAAVVFETIRREGQAELERPALSLAASALAAGISMGASLAGEGILKTFLPDAKWTPLVDGWGYTLGFMIVILGRQQLFTENTVTPVLPLLDNPDKLATLGKMLRLWVIVLACNLVGAAIFAFAAVHSTAFTEEMKATFALLGVEAAKPDFATIVWRGIVSGWLIALMVWLLPGADQLRMFVILIITYVVGIGSFSHIIAGSVEVLFAVFAGAVPFASFYAHFLPAVFIGNVIGGVSLVAILNYGQVVGEGEEGATA